VTGAAGPFGVAADAEAVKAVLRRIAHQMGRRTRRCCCGG